MADSLDNDFPVFTAEHDSVMAKCVTPRLYDKLKGKKSQCGFTIDDVIRPGYDNPYLNPGLAAADEDCYDVFRELFDRAIEEWHGYKPTDSHKKDLDPSHVAWDERIDDGYILSVRVSAVRNIKGLPLPASASRAQRREVERIVSAAACNLSGDLKGHYVPLHAIPLDEQLALASAHLLQLPYVLLPAGTTPLPSSPSDIPPGHSFPSQGGGDEDTPSEGGRTVTIHQGGGGGGGWAGSISDNETGPTSLSTLLGSCGAARDWPDARGLFLTDDHLFAVGVNGEDHIRMVIVEPSAPGSLPRAFGRLARASLELEAALRVEGVGTAYDEHLGFLTTCPSNLGTGLRATAIAKLPLLTAVASKHSTKERLAEIDKLVSLGGGLASFQAICAKLMLYPVRAAEMGEIPGFEGGLDGVWHISNKVGIGRSEAELVQTIVNGMGVLISMEKLLEKGESIEALIPTQPVVTYVDAGCQLARKVEKTRTTFVLGPNCPRFFPAHYEAGSLLAKHLTPEMYESMCHFKPPSGFMLDDVIQPGVDYPDLEEGCVAGADDSYEAFKDLFSAIISDLHAGYHRGATHPQRLSTSLSDVPSTVREKCSSGLDLGGYIRGCGVLFGRNVAGMKLLPCLSRAERARVEQLLKDALGSLGPGFEGTYHSYASMPQNLREELRRRRLLFVKPSKEASVVAAAGGTRDWPFSRGIFVADDRSFVVWVNEEEHVRVVGTDMDSADLSRVYVRLAAVLTALENRLRAVGRGFIHSEHLGYVSPSPASLGTGMHVWIKVQVSVWAGRCR
eukprot:jgi/Mesvir1/28439/Mv15862-RA.2